MPGGNGSQKQSYTVRQVGCYDILLPFAGLYKDGWNFRIFLRLSDIQCRGCYSDLLKCRHIEDRRCRKRLPSVVLQEMICQALIHAGEFHGIVQAQAGNLLQQRKITAFTSKADRIDDPETV